MPRGTATLGRFGPGFRRGKGGWVAHREKPVVSPRAGPRASRRGCGGRGTGCGGLRKITWNGRAGLWWTCSERAQGRAFVEGERDVTSSVDGRWQKNRGRKDGGGFFLRLCVSWSSSNDGSMRWGLTGVPAVAVFLVSKYPSPRGVPVDNVSAAPCSWVW